MKKAVSLILAIVLCLGMCACGSSGSENSKFAGTYTSGETITVKRGTYTPNVDTQETMTLRSDGTGNVETVLSESFGDDSIGTVIKKYDVTWQSDGTYITIKFNLTYYKYSTIDYFGTSVGTSFSKTYELKGTQLFYPDDSLSRWTKES